MRTLMQPFLLTRRRKREREGEGETDRQIEIPGCRHKSERVKSSPSQRMDFVSFCDVFQNIDAAFPLNKKKKGRVTERETEKYLVVAPSPST
jgi:hypothetical protein